jgi:hypothetical protein
LPPLIEAGSASFTEAVNALFPPDTPPPTPAIALTEAESETLTQAIEAPPDPPTLTMDAVKQVQLTQYPPTDNPVAEVKPKITRTAVEAMRKSKKGVAFDIAQGLGITLGEFAGMLPKLGYVIAKGGKLKSTEP